jgi:hypothetical protein
MTSRRLVMLLAVATASVGGATSQLDAGTALAATSTSTSASFAPYRLGARTAATVSLRFSGAAGAVPAPLRGAVLRLPEGLRVQLSGVGVCQAASLRKRGAAGCPAAALLGRGHAQLQVHAGSQTVPENASVWVFRGPNRGAQPTFQILGEGKTPLYQRAISTAVLQRDQSPFGSRLVISVPPIPTLTYEPNASLTSISVTIGNVGTRSRGVIVLPASCPRGGFPFAASFSFEDRTTSATSGNVACPS